MTVAPWATRRFGLGLRHRNSFVHEHSQKSAHEDAPDGHPDAREQDWTVQHLVQPGLRRNPRRAHLLVSTVLGKHLPTDPHRVLDAGNRLGDLVRAALTETTGAPADAPAAVVLGFAETATGLGHCVAARIGARCYLHSTRRDVPTAETLAGFEEGHSHATSHLLQPAPAGIFRNRLPMVLVDDEISTGATALDAIAALHALIPRSHYILASLVDMRADADRAAFAALAATLGVRIDTVCLATGHTELPTGLIDSVAALPDPVYNPVARLRGNIARIELPWPRDVPEGGRHGILDTDTAAFESALATATATLRRELSELPRPRVAPGRDLPVDVVRPVIVLGHEELMYLPLRLAAALADGGIPTRYQTTTRSPAYVIDEPGYPLRRGFRFTAPESGETAPRYLYNAQWPDADAGEPVLLVILDTPADTGRLTGAGGLVDVLTAAGADLVLAVLPGADPAALTDMRTASTPPPEPLRGVRHGPPVVPLRAGDAGAPGPLPEPLRGPDFGSYAADEVGWLLQDLSGVELEREVAEREWRIQAGVAHYAESLPVEYQPDAAYREMFEQVLADSAERLALAVATVSELVVSERGQDIALVSLARAGTPVGVLMRRWLGTRGVEAPHYAMSIVRDRGIDTVALDYLARRHDPASIVFVDGWTGKGAITRELASALDDYHAAGGARFEADLAVLADPGGCVRTYGTRDDFLIASACLNSTVSGLISRTVLNDALIGPGEFHGAKFYRELAPDDVSNHLLDAVTARFDDIRTRVPAAVEALRAADRTPTWAGRESVQRVRAEYGLANINLVKPGVGETTRVLLRRIPWRVLVREAEAPEHAHIRLLAAVRGVPVEVAPELAYACMGLIKTVGE
ncbi:phosphoribosyltransferase [Nocardia sp. NPDC088792]|uniref:phosphoribosyltransferase n=1 Tax=Nocardia sp. NPDC088792 TaxID=3364332 RepID=UPI0037F167DE